MKYLDLAEVQKDLLTLLDEIAVSREEVMITGDCIGIFKFFPHPNYQYDMKSRSETGIRVGATAIIWAFATGMLAICIPLVSMTRSPLLPLAAIAGATISTVVVWHQGDRYHINSPFLTNSEPGNRATNC